MVFSTSYELLADGGTKVTVATVEAGEVFVMQLGATETLENLRAWAAVLGLVVACPL